MSSVSLPTELNTSSLANFPSGDVWTQNGNVYTYLSGGESWKVVVTLVSNLVSSAYVIHIEAPTYYDASTNAISSQTKTYYVYDVDKDASGISTTTMVSKYDVLYEAQNFETLTGNAVDGSVLTHDPSGNQLYSYEYRYTYTNYNFDASGNDGLDIVTYYPGPDASGWASGYTTVTSFSRFIIDASGNIVNFDLLYDASANIVVDASSGKGLFTQIVIAATDASSTYYLAATVTTDPSGQVTYNLTYIPEYDASGVSQTDASGLFFGYWIDVSGSNITLLDPSNNEYHPAVYNWSVANITVNGDNSVTFDGPIIIQLQTVVYEAADPDVDAIVSQINDIINGFSDLNFNYGALSNYQELITAVNDYTTNVNASKINLDLQEITYLEQYASNIQSMASLFGQLVIQMQGAQLVDSEAVAQRMLTALTAIKDGLANLKAFKLAIAEQNLLSISASLMRVTTQVQNLYGSAAQGTPISLTINQSTSNYYVASPSNKPGVLLMLQESLWYFADGLGATATDGEKTYVKFRSATNIVAEQTDYNSWFGLSTEDQANLDAALNLVNSLNSNLASNIQLVLNSPDVVNLKNTLNSFNSLTTGSYGLQNARAQLAHNLGLLGFKIQLTPGI
jgi:hypothetical protein